MKKPEFKAAKYLPYILLGGGGVGLLASFVLTVERFWMFKNPSYSPSCNINPLFSCVSVANTPQSETFGFPNMLFGVVAYAMVMAVGAVMLAGGRMKPWFWQIFGLGTLGGIIFVHWLFVQSVYVIGALCVYCMSVWAATAPIFWYTFIFNVQEGNIKFLSKYKGLQDFLCKYHGLILASWYFIIFILLLQRFWGEMSALL